MTRIFRASPVPIVLWLIAALVPFATCAYAGDDKTVAIPVRFFRVSDDDGKRESALDVDALGRQLDFMNKAFEPAHARLARRAG